MTKRKTRLTLSGVLWTLVLILLLIAAVLTGQAFFASGEGTDLQFASLGQLWFTHNPGSLNLLQAVTERYLSVALWDEVIFPLLGWPAPLVFAAAALLPGLPAAVITFRRRRRR